MDGYVTLQPPDIAHSVSTIWTNQACKVELPLLHHKRGLRAFPSSPIPAVLASDSRTMQCSAVHPALLHPSIDSTDALRFIFGQLSPAQIRRARQVSCAWRDCADDATLWKAHTKNSLQSQSISKGSSVVLCNEIWECPPDAVQPLADPLGMSSVAVNMQGYRDAQNVELVSAAITDVSFLAELPNLTSLTLTDNQHLVDIRGLRHCTGLRSLTFRQGFVMTPSQQASIERFPREKALWEAVAKMKDLEELYLGVQEGGGGTCDWISNVEVVAALPRLRLLSLKGCCKVKDLSPIVRSTSLQVVDLRGVGYSSRELWTLQGCGGLARALLGQDEYDEDPREDAPAELRDKLVLAPVGALGHLGEAVGMTGGFAVLKSSGSWGIGNLMCY